MNKNTYFIGIYILIIGMLVASYGATDVGYENILHFFETKGLSFALTWCFLAIAYYCFKEYITKKTEKPKNSD